MFRFISVVALCLSLSVAVVRGDSPFPAHCVAGNTYYVGSHELASYLITTSVSIPFMKCGGPPARSVMKHSSA